MNYGKILGVFQRKTQLKNIENLKLSEGKIEVNYFKSILKIILETCGRIEFNPQSRHAWRWNDVPIGKFAALLSAPATQSAGLRAEIIKPCIGRNTVKSYLADLLECSIEEINESNPIRNLTLSVCGHQPKSYLTTLIWMEQAFGFKTPQDIINHGNVKDLLDYIVRA